MSRIAIAIPIYLPTLPVMDEYSLDHSVRVLQGRTLTFIAPPALDVSYYRERYLGIGIEYFESDSFASIPAYNRLLLGKALYQRFEASEFLLILQTDAIILRDELDAWMALPFD